MLRAPQLNRTKEDLNNEGENYQGENSSPMLERAIKLVTPVLERIQKMRGTLKGLRVADVGCGTGELASYIAEQGATVVAFDVSESMINKAKKKHIKENLSFDVQDAATFELDGKYDLIVSTSALQWVSDENIANVFRQIDIHLKPAGEVHVLVPTYDHPHIVLSTVANSEKWAKHFQDADEPQSLKRGQKGYQNLLEKAGLVKIRLYKKDSEHKKSPEAYLNFVKQWSFYFQVLSDQTLEAEFENDVLDYLRTLADEQTGIITFTQTSLIMESMKPELSARNTQYFREEGGPTVEINSREHTSQPTGSKPR